MDVELSNTAQSWVVLVLAWVGFGFLVGLSAKALIPGQEPRGPFGTLVLGTLGSFIGPWALEMIWEIPGFHAISPLGFFAALIMSIALLISYRALVAIHHAQET